MHEPANAPAGARAVETSDVDARRVVAVAAVLLVVLALAAGAIWGLLRWWQVPVGAGPYAPRDFRTEAPRLLPAPLDERAAFVAEKDRRLRGYGWVDRHAGFAHIPVEVAMDMLAGGEASADERAAAGGER